MLEQVKARQLQEEEEDCIRKLESSHHAQTFGFLLYTWSQQAGLESLPTRSPLLCRFLLKLYEFTLIACMLRGRQIGHACRIGEQTLTVRTGTEPQQITHSQGDSETTMAQ